MQIRLSTPTDTAADGANGNNGQGGKAGTMALAEMHPRSTKLYPKRCEGPASAGPFYSHMGTKGYSGAGVP